MARCAVSKGRSPSGALTVELRQIGSHLCGFWTLRFSSFLPNAAHAWLMLLLATLRYRLLHPGTPSTIKSIFRSSPLSLDFGDGLPTGSLGDRFASLPSLLYRAPAMDFDSCLGFPGEGPTLPVLFRVGVWVVVFVPLRGCLGAPCRHGALELRNAGNTARQVFRRERPLPEGPPC